MYNITCPTLGKPIRIKELVLKNYEVPGMKGDKTKCVEFIVVGNYREWIDYATLKDFKKANPNFDVEEALENGN